MTRLLHSSWIVALIGAGLYVAVTALMFHPANLIPRASAPGHVALNVPRPSWEFYNPEVTRLVAELKEEKRSLTTRKQQLEELAARLAAERAELNVVTQAVYQMQREFDRNLLRVKDEEQANLKRLAKTYATMTPESAANIFKEMEDDQVVKILLFMREKETAALLESMAQLGEADVKRVALLTERLRTALFRNTKSTP